MQGLGNKTRSVTVIAGRFGLCNQEFAVCWAPTTAGEPTGELADQRRQQEAGELHDHQHRGQGRLVIPQL